MRSDGQNRNVGAGRACRDGRRLAPHPAASLLGPLPLQLLPLPELTRCRLPRFSLQSRPALHKSSRTCSMSSSMCTVAVLRRALPLRRPGGCRSRRAIARALSTDSFFISRNSKSQPVQVSRSFISQSRERVLSGIQPTGVPHIGAHP